MIFNTGLWNVPGMQWQKEPRGGHSCSAPQSRLSLPLCTQLVRGDKGQGQHVTLLVLVKIGQKKHITWSEYMQAKIYILK